ncbi:aldehyde dehydrogenase family protein, partial [Salmonella enterica]|uniref:aldehyde dehydrogenase family protein n=1 Tax=Salmonella enterica TaxID=28901 RepID=UPI000BDDBF5A
LHVGGTPRESKGYFFERIILTNITRDNRAYFDVFFGPVAQMFVVKDDDDAVILANDSHFGLGGAVCSQNI